MTADIFVPQSKPDQALIGPLQVITWVSSDPDGVYKMLVEGFDLQASDWFFPEGDEKTSLDAYFGFSEKDSWKARKFFRTDDGANIEIRLISVDETTPQVRPEINGVYVGGLSIGFPVLNSDTLEAHLKSIGYPSMVGVKRLEFPNPAGGTYISEETHWVGPENIYFLGVNRPDIFVPVGPVHKAAELGAPAYSAQCVPDCEASVAFYRDIFGYEIRRDMTMTVGSNSGLKLKEGSPERFVQAFAPGSQTGYLVILDHFDDRIDMTPGESKGPPNRGLVMWSFPCKNLVEIHKRAVTAGVKVLQAPAISNSPFLAGRETLILEDPSGYPVELYKNNA